MESHVSALKKKKNSLTKNIFRKEKFIWFLTKFKTNIDKNKLSNRKVKCPCPGRVYKLLLILWNQSYPNEVSATICTSEFNLLF